MSLPWHLFPINVTYGESGVDSGLGFPHDMDIAAPPNYPITALLSGTVCDLQTPSWGVQVGIQLDSPWLASGEAIPYMAYLHLAASNVSMGQHVNAGDVIGWTGGATSDAQYLGTVNPTGKNFLNSTDMSSWVQAGIALMRGPVYGSGAGWDAKDAALDPMPIVKQARSNYVAAVAVQKLGRIGLFFGVDTFSWTTAQWQAAVAFCVAHKVNFAIIKVFEITQGEWYAGAFSSIAKLFTDAGVQVLPYGFLYGGSGLAWEIAELEKFEAEFGVVCADMEGQWWWNNPSDGQAVADALSGRSGLFFGSIPADPSADTFQPMNKVMLAMPMSYDDSLVAATRPDMAQIGGMPVYPTLDLSVEFGPNNVVANAQWASAFDQVSFWYYGFATANPALFDQAVAIVGSLPAGGEMGLPTNWTDDGAALHNPITPFVVTQGFRQYILDHSWDAANVPLENVEGANPIEESNPALGGGTRQAFRGTDGNVTQAEWTSARGVFPGWVGPELLFLRNDRNAKAAALASAQATLATCQAALAACEAAGGGVPAAIQSAIDQAASDLAVALSNATAVVGDIQTLQGIVQPFVK